MQQRLQSQVQQWYANPDSLVLNYQLQRNCLNWLKMVIAPSTDALPITVMVP